MERIRLRTEVQLQMMSMLMAGAPNSHDPLLAMVRTSLQQQLQLAAQGKADARGFRMQVQNRLHYNDLMPTQSPGSGQSGPNSSLTATPLPTGQYDSGTPSGNGYGPSGYQTTTPIQNGSSMPSGNGSSGYLTTTPMQNGTGPFMGQQTPAPGSGKMP